jgi:hypothetical protein
MAPYNFDDSYIKWNTLTLPPVGELKHLLFSVLNVDEESHIVHVLDIIRNSWVLRFTLRYCIAMSS